MDVVSLVCSLISVKSKEIGFSILQEAVSPPGLRSGYIKPRLYQLSRTVLETLLQGSSNRKNYSGYDLPLHTVPVGGACSVETSTKACKGFK